MLVTYFKRAPNSHFQTSQSQGNVNPFHKCQWEDDTSKDKSSMTFRNLFTATLELDSEHKLDS